MNLIDPFASSFIFLIERGWLPDSMIRLAIRQLIGMRARSLYSGGEEKSIARSVAFLEQAESARELAIETDKANEQHYEVPAEFFNLVLGKHKKYSCCFFSDADSTLDQAEAAALSISCQRAEIEDGMSILELGCGWGSLTLWMAERYPNSTITAVSNSKSQRAWILQQARIRGIASNLQVITCDINELNLDKTFDRIVSVEMFEHVRNHRRLLQRVSPWLAEDGQLFVHIFCHKRFAYPFETKGAANWMGRHFFSGGMMPSQDLFERLDEHLKQTEQWTWNGRHYQQTANAWAANLDRNQNAIRQLFRKVYGVGQETKWFMRWKVFFLACAELFGSNQGEEWFVTHCLFRHSKQIGKTTETTLSSAE
jgi:cyclopropane-fatty-acyl-phospholipid synthase